MALVEECRLGFSNLHVIPTIENDPPPNYVVVEYTCPCGEFSARFALHHYLLYHLTGRTNGMERRPEAHHYLQLLTVLQAEALYRPPPTMNKNEESPER